MLMLNDGGGGGPVHVNWNEQVTYRYNIIRNCVGNTQSIAPDFHHKDPMCFGFYYGDHSPANGIVEYNTVVDASGAGTLVDSSRILDGSGNIVPVMGQVVRYNNFFGCGIGILLTDQSLYWRNYQVVDCNPRINSPCFVSQINKLVYNNNVYSTSMNHIGLQQHYVFSNGAGAVVDFGTSNNNNFFHPMNPNKTIVRRYDNGLTPIFNGVATAIHNMTLTQWQQATGEDMNSKTTSGATNLASADNRGRILVNDTFTPKLFSTCLGNLEFCIFKLDGTPVGTSITLPAMSSLILEKGTGCP